MGAAFTKTSPAPEISLVPAPSSDSSAWDSFVETHPEGRFSQQWAYKNVLEAVYGYKCVYLKILLGEQLVGVFPSIALNRGAGRLISQPFQEYGGPLLSEAALPHSASIAKSLLEVAESHNCRSLEFRGGVGCDKLAETSFCVRHPLYQYAVLALSDKESLWRKAMNQEARKGISKSQEFGLIAEVRRGKSAIAGKFESMYLISMKRLGVPPHGMKFFSELANSYGDGLVASWVQHHGKDIAVLLGLVTGTRIQVYVTASDPSFWSMRPNDLAHWELIQWAYSNGLKLFDFGSARYAGQIHYKKKWGCKFYDYSYYLLGRPGSTELAAIQTVNSSSDSMKRAAHIWEKYVPIPITKWLGPPIRKYLTK